ncbi:ice-binding family protein [Ruania halotolerans]|uniref:ice-binding family protein n=1 Tax=Ruania halotolerans TaxID=2897773 RepID=UPI001E33E0D8|nr:ice-binding family protein [Ruania halotolerans]UFU07254.1 ice-binding family protein [Ruania halotolerans]
MVIGILAVISALVLASIALTPLPASAATPAVGVGTAQSYSVLGGQTVTNTGPTTLGADLGVSPGTAITGFPPGTLGGTVHAGDAPAAQAQSDLVIAYDDAAGRAPTASVSGDLVGQTLTDGVYNSSGPLELSGTLTLDAQGDPNSVFIFQVASTLITATSSDVALINGAQACNVFWQVGSSATLGTGSTFIGTIMALTSISVTTGTVVEGRALARNGQVSLDTNVFTTPGCDTDPTETPTEEPSESPTGEPTGTPTEPPTDGPTDTPTDGPTGTPTGDSTVDTTGASNGDTTDDVTGDMTGDTTGDATDGPDDGGADSSADGGPDARAAGEADGSDASQGADSELSQTGLGPWASALLGVSGLLLLVGLAALVHRRRMLQ